jgi:outer membrane biosynthesis protein TonB
MEPPVCEQCPVVPYPEIAKDPRVNAQGSVELRLLVDEQGGVTVVSATYRPLPSRRAATRDGPKILASAAADWVKKKWRYRPARRGGAPMRMEITQPVDFVLDK